MIYGVYFDTLHSQTKTLYYYQTKKIIEDKYFYSLLLLLRKDLNYEIRQLQICWIISVIEQAGKTRPGTTVFIFLLFIASLSQPDRGVICGN